jgi:hypothetical protein
MKVTMTDVLVELQLAIAEFLLATAAATPEALRAPMDESRVKRELRLNLMARVEAAAPRLERAKAAVEAEVAEKLRHYRDDDRRAM